jgi:hypothetical protein
MKPFNLPELVHYIHENIFSDFHEKKMEKLKKITLNHLIKRKNPYLFKAKGSVSAHDFVKSILDATVSSGEETTFGNFLEKIAIFVCEQVHGGRKSGIRGLDLEFEDGNKKYLISIKSGPNWGNSGQIKNLINNFNSAKKTLATSGGAVNMHIVCVEACCYGSDNTPDKGTHLRLCGQRFWELISGGDENLYREIIEPLGYLAKERNNEIDVLFNEKLNVLSAAFVTQFCDEKGKINWDKLIRTNSGKA